MDDLSSLAHQHWHAAIVVLAIWLWVSLSMIVTLWLRHSTTSLISKLFWSMVLLIPALGWMMYLGFFRPPSLNKAGESAAVSPYVSGGSSHL